MRRDALRHMVPGPLSLDDSEEAANWPAPASGIEKRLDVVKTLTRIAPIHREVLVLYYFDDMPTVLINGLDYVITRDAERSCDLLSRGYALSGTNRHSRRPFEWDPARERTSSGAGLATHGARVQAGVSQIETPPRQVRRR